MATEVANGSEWKWSTIVASGIDTWWSQVAGGSERVNVLTDVARKCM